MEETNTGSKIDPERKRKLLRRTLRVMEEFKKLDPEMPLQQMITFVEIALASEDGISVSDLATKVGNSQSSASRHVAVLGDFGRGKTPALQVVKASVNPMDRRVQIVKLSHKGKMVIDHLLEVVNKEV